jgi:hypothetical protein
MLILEKRIFSLKRERSEKEVFYKFIWGLGTIANYLEILRLQVSETKLLQLGPGIYFFLLFCFLSFFLMASEIFVTVCWKLQRQKNVGFKSRSTVTRMILMRMAFSFVTVSSFFFLNTLIPLSFDSLNSFSESSFENLWSFNQVLSVESYLIIIGVGFGVFPIVLSSFLRTEKYVSLFVFHWKSITLFAFCLAGALTPTVDIWTQCAFSVTFLVFFFLFLNLVQKEWLLPFEGGISFH